MADSKISALPASTVPLAGTEVLPIVQSSTTRQVSVANLTAGRDIAATSLTTAAVQATNSSGLTLKNAGGTTQLSLGAGGGSNITLAVATSITDNIIQGTAAKGVNFTANTPAAGMTSQLLNWYEEGTFTPVYVAQTGTLGTVTYDNVQGRYTRIGRLVTVIGGFYCTAFAAGTGSGDLRIGGLPFANAAFACAITVGDSRLFTLNNPTGGQVGYSGSYITLFYRTTANGAATSLQVSDAATGTGALNLVYFSGSYQV